MCYIGFLCCVLLRSLWSAASNCMSWFKYYIFSLCIFVVMIVWSKVSEIKSFPFIMECEHNRFWSCDARLSFLIAESCLLAGSAQNAYHTRYRTLYIEDPPSCETLRKGVFAAGAAFAFFTAILSEFYYISFSKANDSGALYGKEPTVGLSPYA